MMGVAKIIVQASQLFAVLASNSSCCHLANGVLNTDTLLSKFCPSLQKWLRDKENRERGSSAYIAALHHHLRMTLDWVTVMKFKITLILRAFCDFPRKSAAPKITHHTVYKSTV